METQDTKFKSKILAGDCLQTLKELPDNSVDSIVTDPPYGLAFMGKKWDYDVPSTEIWKEAFRVLKPGGHLLAFFGTRTYHRGAVRIEDAGFEIRDMCAWLYGSGFPKSLDISKALDKKFGAEREVIGLGVKGGNMRGGNLIKGEAKAIEQFYQTAPATDEAKQWQGWGTALKPAHEPIVVARKPIDGTVADNVLKHGVGGLNIDGCRIETTDSLSGSGKNPLSHGGQNHRPYHDDPSKGGYEQNSLGRFPANVLLDEEAAEVLDAQSGITKDGVAVKRNSAGKNIFSETKKPTTADQGYGGSGGASRFFYVAKASKKERNAGLEGMPTKEVHRYGAVLGEGLDPKAPSHDKNHHPTVKPVQLMRYLVRLVTPVGGTVLDPFMGSGTTGCAAIDEGMQFIGCEMSPEYIEIAEKRIAFHEELAR